MPKEVLKKACCQTMKAAEGKAYKVLEAAKMVEAERDHGSDEEGKIDARRIARSLLNFSDKENRPMNK